MFAFMVGSTPEETFAVTGGPIPGAREGHFNTPEGAFFAGTVSEWHFAATAALFGFTGGTSQVVPGGTGGTAGMALLLTGSSVEVTLCSSPHDGHSKVLGIVLVQKLCAQARLKTEQLNIAKYKIKAD